MTRPPGTGGGPRDHDELVQTLPWYVNGSLDEAELSWVERHLADCETCRLEVEQLARLRQAVREESLQPPTPHPAVLARLRARIDADDELGLERRGRLARSLLASMHRVRESRFARSLAATPSALRWALAAQLAVIAVLALGRMSAEPPASFHTLSDAPATAAERELRILFAEDLTERELRSLLLPLSAQLRAGPSPLGVYTVAVPQGAAREPLAVVVAHLRAQAAVRFVEEIPLAEASRR